MSSYPKINKKKIMNDPVHGFINISYDLLFDLIEHSYFQRLRRIMQLGLTYYVYPGATHCRFQHVIGATHLMNLAIDVIRSKGHEITEIEAEAVSAAILLHDIGHGPFSHTLENIIIKDINHEDLSKYFMNRLNAEFDNKLDLTIKIFNNKYKKKFLHQLVSGQLDVDRMDYLKRDSFFTGVSEGVIGSDRIIKMLNVVDDNLVIEAKGIYSIEKFLIARRLMYWQVYQHKTVLVAEQILINTIKRAIYLARNGENLFATSGLKYFLEDEINKSNFLNNPETLNYFASLDDTDIICSIKSWCSNSDTVLSELSKRLINRQLFKIEMQYTPFDESKVHKIKELVIKKYNLSQENADYFVITDKISINAYSDFDDRINILFKNGETKDITEATDMLNHDVLSKTVIKYYLIYPKECSIK
ncbi:MAG: HD domain-containing protein [Bacteroidota bacterium]